MDHIPFRSCSDHSTGPLHPDYFAQIIYLLSRDNYPRKISLLKDLWEGYPGLGISYF